MKSNLFKKQFVVITVATLFTGLLFQNCSQLGSSDDVASSGRSAPAINEQEILLQKSMLIMETNCAACHNNEVMTNGVNVTSLDQMLVQGVIVVNEPILSPIIQVLQNPTVAEHGILKQKDINTLSRWIAEGFKDGADGGGVVVADPIPLGPTWRSVNQNIISRRCTGCHNAVTNSGGVSFTTLAGVRSRLVAGNAAGSEFFQRISTVAPLIPLGCVPLTPQDQTAISQWITAGALDN